MTMNEIIIDATSYTAGRLASISAKEVLNGNRVHVVNASKAIVSGNPDHTIEVFGGKISRGDPYNGPFYPRTPERMVKRMVRGMLPTKPRGRDAFKRLRVYRDFPEELRKKEVQEFKGKRFLGKSITLEKLSQMIGGKVK